MFETTNQDLVCTHLWHSLVLSGVTTWWHVDHLLKVNLWSIDMVNSYQFHLQKQK